MPRQRTVSYVSNNSPLVRWIEREGPVKDRASRYRNRVRVLQYREERRYGDRVEWVWVDVPKVLDEAVRAESGE